MIYAITIFVFFLVKIFAKDSDVLWYFLASMVVPVLVGVGILGILGVI